MENLEIFRNEFKKYESIENLFEREWYSAIQTKKKCKFFKNFLLWVGSELSENVTETTSKFNNDKTMMFYKKLNPNLEKLKSYCVV